jgi:DNA-binding transcriptional MerR regulator
MASNQMYSSAEVCKMLDISKSTLFRWEADGLLPPVRRSLKGQRQYTEEHIRAISQEQLRKQFKRIVKSEADQREVMEVQSLVKFLAGDVTGLTELAQYHRLSLRTIRELIRVALKQYEPGDPTFCEIIEVVYRQSCSERA